MSIWLPARPRSRHADERVFAYERMGYPNLLTAISNDPITPRSITCQTGFGANVQLHNYTGPAPRYLDRRAGPRRIHRAKQCVRRRAKLPLLFADRLGSFKPVAAACDAADLLRRAGPGHRTDHERCRPAARIGVVRGRHGDSRAAQAGHNRLDTGAAIERAAQHRRPGQVRATRRDTR